MGDAWADRPGYVILGGGLAGYSAANTLRLGGFDGRIVLVGREDAPPYERPPLSKAFLQGKKFAAELVFQPATRYAELEIELRLGRAATAVDFAARRVRLDDGAALPYDKLLIATGADPIRPPIPGIDLEGVSTFRTLDDAAALAAELDARSHVVIVGAGFIGCEVAASLRGLGHHVTLVDLAATPLERALGAEVGRLVAQVHRRSGVDLRLEERVVALHGNRQGRVEAAELSGGERIACGMVVVGVGVRPAVAPFAGGPLALDDGVVCDELCRTNVPDVYAAGDVANWWHPGIERRIRVEHYDNAALQGAAAAKSMLGQAEPYGPVPYFWSDQYDLNLQYVGYPLPWDQLVLRGEPETPAVTAFYLTSGAVIAGATINRPRELRSLRRLVEARARLDPQLLADPATDLRALSRTLRS